MHLRPLHLRLGAASLTAQPSFAPSSLGTTALPELPLDYHEHLPNPVEMQC